MSRYSLEFGGFLVVGLVVNLLAISCFHLLHSYFSINPLYLVFPLFIVATVVSYALNAKFVFTWKNYSISQLLRFMAVYLTAPMIQAVILMVGMGFRIHPTLAYLIGIAVTTVSNFVLLKLIVFR